MHERYMFMADILSIIWFLLYQHKIYIPIIINLSSLAGYTVYLFGFKWMPLWLFSCLMLIVIISLLFEVIEKKIVLPLKKHKNSV